MRCCKIMTHRSQPLPRRQLLDILCVVRTIIRIDEHLLEQVRQEAERRGISLGTLVEQALHLVLRVPAKSLARRGAADDATHPNLNLNASAQAWPSGSPSSR